MDKHLLEKMNDNKKAEKNVVCIEMGQFPLPCYERSEEKEKDKKKEVILAVTEKCVCGKDHGQKNVEQEEMLNEKKMALILYSMNRRENLISAAERLERNAVVLLILFGMIILSLALISLKISEDGCE